DRCRSPTCRGSDGGRPPHGPSLRNPPAARGPPMTIFRPDSAAQVQDVVAAAVSQETPLELVSRASKRTAGRPMQAAHTLDLSALAGVGLYEPEELICQAAPGTPVAEIEAMLAERRQMLAFEPMDLGPLLTGEAGQGSIGGVFACNLAGPRRIKA